MTNKLEKTPLALAMGLAWSMSGQAADMVLPEVKVEAKREAKQESYRATTTRVGKTLQDPHEIPQAVTTVTNNIMEEQQVGSLREALRNVSGLTFNAAEGGRSGDNMMLRGFYTFGDMYLDGMRDTAQYNRETFNLEQIDVLRGSAAMLFGRGQAGGVINQVSKTPILRDKHKVTASIGTDNYTELTGDFNKRVGDSAAWRVNVMKRDEGSWRTNPATGTEANIDRGGVAVSYGYGLGLNDEFIVSHIMTKTDDSPDYGVRFDSTTRLPQTYLPASTFYNTDQNFDESDTNITTFTYTKRFKPGTEWRTQLRQADYERSYWAKTPANFGATLTQTACRGTPAAPNATASANCSGDPTRGADYETLNLQTDFNTVTTLANMEHQLLVGAEYLKENSFRNALRNYGGSASAATGIYAAPPDYRPYDYATPGNPNSFKSDSYAIYGQDTVEFIPGWRATLGARRDFMDAQYSSATSPKLKYGEWSYRSALSWQPREEAHYYVGYSDSFSPTADLYQLTVAPLPPERSNVLELGAKWLMFEGDLALRAALYRAEKDWERNTDLESTSAILTKKRRTDGLELEAAGRVNEKWEVFAGLALMDAKILEVAENVNATTGAITQANAGYKGQRARNTPEYTVNAWSTYKLGGGWKIGGGLEAKGERYGFNPSGAGTVPTMPGQTDFHPNTAPSYVRWDAMASYEQGKYGVRLNVQNLFDKLYYDSLYDNGGFAIPGTKRKVILTGEMKF